MSSPEEGVMLDADLPETLGRAVVGQLEANGALKLFVLGGERDALLQADPALEDTRDGTRLAKALGFPWQEPQPCRKKPSSKQSWKGLCPAPLGGGITPPHFWPENFPPL